MKGKDITQGPCVQDEIPTTLKSEEERAISVTKCEFSAKNEVKINIPENANHAVMDNSKSSLPGKHFNEELPVIKDAAVNESTFVLVSAGDEGKSTISSERTLAESGDTTVDMSSQMASTKCCETSKDKAELEIATAPEIHSLPLDSLHSVASFLTPSEWCNGFGLANKTLHSHCRAIVRRVRMHAFKCATEVVCAWKVGQWEDARELTALYIQSGVPIYSRCLGHSYHTIHWRMKVEASEIRAEIDAEAAISQICPQVETVKIEKVDCFFGTAKAEFRVTEEIGPTVTYLEEKCQFWIDQIAASDTTATLRGGGSPNTRRSPPQNNAARGDTARSTAPSQTSRKQQQQHDSSNTPKIYVAIHQHLLDRHRLGEYFVNDKDGRMATPTVNLSADFFHPSTRVYSKGKAKARVSADDQSATTNDLAMLSTSVVAAAAEGWSVSDLSLGDELPPPPPAPSMEESDLASLEPQSPKSLLGLVELEVYSSTLSSSMDDGLEYLHEVQRHLQSRFATYQRRLEAFLLKGDTCSYDDCILDFWDEFFPHTSGIHYHDSETAVPRISCMQTFLTKPCPKAIGVVQCEIERIKISTRGKGVNVAGRLFPTYEYRLFIRNQSCSETPESASTTESDDFVRRDTVLIVAKNLGRKHAEPSGVLPMSAAAKKGSNNYYLYMPQQMDVDDHFNKVNEHLAKPARLEPNGASFNPVLVSNNAGSVLLGRLQSNFIGTEFQIFTPQLRKLPPRKPDPSVCQPFSSEDELDYDSGVSSDAARRSRFSRFRRSNAANPANSDAGSVGSPPTVDRPLVKRALSSPDISYQVRHPRSNRRAIANDTQRLPQSALCEEEAGAITYTANLLGSRPRIMDVCIPRVTLKDIVGAEWKRYLYSCDDTDDCRMLSCFRQLQQRRENQEQQVPPAQDNNTNEDADSEAADETDFGLMSLQNRPPWWNVDLGSFVLNFGGRVSVASVKNFQLCERTNQDRIMLQFGRIKGRHSFTMDFQHPLTAVQAFSIAISSLQSKISFG